MSTLGRIISMTLFFALIAWAPTGLALDGVQETGDPVASTDEDPDPRKLIDQATTRTKNLVDQAFRVVEETARSDDNEDEEEKEEDDRDTAPPVVGSGLLGSIGSYGGFALAAAGITGVIAAAGLLLTSRYATPKEVLKKPQRAMLYGCIKGNPGVNLKQLSEDFDMKTSTVLWHIRKLEAADLVRSQKANGLRVFYPVAGGIAAKRLGLAVATLSNQNAAKILDYIAVNPGIAQKNLVTNLNINAGTVRWHLRKLKDMGLMAELSQGRMCTYYATELGLKALRQAHGISNEVKSVPEIVSEAEAGRAAPS